MFSWYEMLHLWQIFITMYLWLHIARYLLLIFACWFLLIYWCSVLPYCNHVPILLVLRICVFWIFCWASDVKNLWCTCSLQYLPLDYYFIHKPLRSPDAGVVELVLLSSDGDYGSVSRFFKVLLHKFRKPLLVCDGFEVKGIPWSSADAISSYLTLDESCCQENSSMEFPVPFLLQLGDGVQD